MIGALSEHDNRRADLDPRIKIDDVVVHKADAAGRHRSADCVRLVGAVNAKHRVAMAVLKIPGAGAGRNGKAAFH